MSAERLRISRPARKATLTPSGNPASSLSDAGERLLRAACQVAENERSASEPAALSEFVQLYRDWITTNRGRPGTQEQQAEQWQLLMYAMITAPQIGESIGLLIRFSKVVWGERGPSELRIDNGMAQLVFKEPFTRGPEGLVAALWSLALTLCELEFLAGTSFDGARGTVLHESILPEGIVRLLFSAPVLTGCGEVALVFPERHLQRPVAVRATDLPAFFQRLLPLTLGARREPPSIASVAAGLIHDDKRGPDFRESSLSNVASRLAMSEATLRRRLTDEGTTYRQVKEAVYDALAKDWLSRGDIAIGLVAERLDFSDTFAFRRFFRRKNGISPSAARSAGKRRATSG